jgi:prolyl-tRNA synthetase
MGISVKYDDRDTHKPGWKFSEYEFKGVPVRITIGPRDIEQGTVEVARRDTLEKEIFQMTDIENKIGHLLDQIQQNLYDKAFAFRENSSYFVDTWDEFKEVIDNKGGFVYAHWDGTPETEEKIKEETKATIRIIPLNNQMEPGKCVYSGKPSTQRVVFAKAY